VHFQPVPRAANTARAFQIKQSDLKAPHGRHEGRGSAWTCRPEGHNGQVGNGDTTYCPTVRHLHLLKAFLPCFKNLVFKALCLKTLILMDQNHTF
jgi:hypothetical protein